MAILANIIGKEKLSGIINFDVQFVKVKEGNIIQIFETTKYTVPDSMAGMNKFKEDIVSRLIDLQNADNYYVFKIGDIINSSGIVKAGI